MVHARGLRHALFVPHAVLLPRLLLGGESLLQLGLLLPVHLHRLRQLRLPVLLLLGVLLARLGEQLLYPRLFLGDGGHGGGVRGNLGRRRANRRLALGSLLGQQLLQASNLHAKFVGDDGESLNLLGGGFVFSLPRGALLPQRLLQRRALLFRRLLQLEILLLRCLSLLGALGALRLERRRQLRELLLEGGERGGGGFGGALILRALNLARLRLGGEEQGEAGDLLVELCDAPLGGGGDFRGGFPVGAAPLLLRFQLLLRVVARLLRRRQRRHVRQAQAVNLRLVVLDETVHLNLVRLPQRLAHNSLAKLRLFDDERANLLLLLNLRHPLRRLRGLQLSLQHLDLSLELGVTLQQFSLARREISLGLIQQPLQLVALSLGFIASLLNLGQRANLLGGALELLRLEVGHALAQLLNLRQRGGFALGGGAQAHAQDAVLHANLLLGRLLLVALHAHSLELLAQLANQHRVFLDGDGEGALRRAELVSRRLRRLERRLGKHQFMGEQLLLLALLLQLSLHLLTAALLLGEPRQRLRQPLVHRLCTSLPHRHVLRHRHQLLSHQHRLRVGIRGRDTHLQGKVARVGLGAARRVQRLAARLRGGGRRLGHHVPRGGLHRAVARHHHSRVGGLNAAVSRPRRRLRRLDPPVARLDFTRRRG